jgi:hypothetical protein
VPARVARRRHRRDRATLGAGEDRFVNATPLPVELFGEGENDTLVGGPAGDRLDGGPGDDALSGSAGDDELETGPGNDAVKGGLGDDALTGSDGNDDLFGEQGEDRLDGAAGQDQLRGGDQDDALIGSPFPDDLQGGDGVDTVDFAAAGSAGVTVTLDDRADDGGVADRIAGLADNAHSDTERVNGSAGNDLLVGSAAANALAGRGGDDILQAGPGDDRLVGGSGRDTLAGGPGTDTATWRDHQRGVSVSLDDVANDGNDIDARADDVRSDVENLEGTDAGDRLIGNAGPNRLDALDGIDVLDGRAGTDKLLGGADDDREIFAQDGGPDEVSCGSGTDAAALDLADVPTPVFEQVLEPRGPPPQQLAASDCELAFAAPAGELPILGLTAHRARRGARMLRVGVRCAASAARPCLGRLAADALGHRQARRLGSAAFTLRAGEHATVAIPLGRADRRAMRRSRRLRVLAVARGPSGRPHAAIVHRRLRRGRTQRAPRGR